MTGPPLQVISAGTAAWTNDDALAQARTLSAEQLNATVLAAAWGWHRSKVQRRLKRWHKDGLIVAPAKVKPGRKKRASRRSARSAGARAGTTGAAACDQGAAVAPPPVEIVPHDLRPDEKGRAAGVSMAIGAILAVTAIALGGVGATLNISHAYAFGGSAQSGIQLAVLGASIDALTLVLPGAGALLWEIKARLAALGSWLIFCLVLTMSLIAACGFTSTQVGDSVQNRSNVAGKRAALVEKLQRLRHERSAIAEARSVAAIDAALQAAPAAAQAVWKQTRGCQDVTLPDSAKACAGVISLRQARGEAVRRDGLDQEISDGERELATLPAYASADPGAEMAAKLIGVLTGGHVRITSEMIEQIRIGGMTVMPAAAGILLSFAQMLLRPGRRRAQRATG